MAHVDFHCFAFSLLCKATEVILGDLLKFRHIIAVLPAQLAFVYMYMVFVRLFLYLSTLFFHSKLGDAL